MSAGRIPVRYRPDPIRGLRDADPRDAETTVDEMAERYAQAAIIRHCPKRYGVEAAQMLGLIPSPTPGSGSGGNAAKTHCRNGHEYTPENTYVYMGSRLCRTCRALRAAGAKSHE